MASRLFPTALVGVCCQGIWYHWSSRERYVYFRQRGSQDIAEHNVGAQKHNAGADQPDDAGLDRALD